MTQPVDVDYKLLFVKWLKEAAIEATRKALKTAILYNKAMSKLNAFNLEISNLQDLKLVPYVGEKTLKLLLERLKSHCEAEDIPFPDEFSIETQPNTKPARKRAAPLTALSSTAAKRKYIPRHRSGGYAILIALYILDRDMSGRTQKDIVEVAAKFSDKPFSKPTASDFHSAWDSYKTLAKHDLISVFGRAPRNYALTEEGVELASKLKQAEGLDSSPMREEADISYDNGLRVTPNNTMDGSPLKKRRPDNKMPDFLHELDTIGENVTPQTFLKTATPPFPSISLDNYEDSPEPTPEIFHDKENRLVNGISYSIWDSIDYEVKLVVDNREIGSFKDREYFERQLTLLRVNCEVVPLTIGDVLWVARHRGTGREIALNYIGERKRLDDLCLSIKDGRYQEQKNRLLKTQMKHPFYIVEERQSDRITEMMLSIRSAISQTMTNAEFYVRLFEDIEGTIQFLASMTQSIQDEFTEKRVKLVVMKPKSLNNQIEYDNILTAFRYEFEREANHTIYECGFYINTFLDCFAKGDMMSVKDMYLLMLMSVRGVSLEKAVVIQSKFPTPKLLLEFYHTDHKDMGEKEKKQLLDKEFKHMVGNKKIGKLTLERLYNVWGV